MYLFVQRKEKPLNHFIHSNVNQSDDRCSAEETTPFKNNNNNKKKGPLLAPSWLFSSVAFCFGPYHTLGHFCSSGSARLQLSSSNSLSPGISLQTVLGDSANLLWKLNWLQVHTRSTNNDTSKKKSVRRENESMISFVLKQVKWTHGCFLTTRPTSLKFNWVVTQLSCDDQAFA